MVETTITDFISSAYDEEEETARAATPGPWLAERAVLAGTGGAWAVTDPGGEIVVISEAPAIGDAQYVAAQSPDRMLADIAAKRRILAEHPHEEADPDAPGGGTENFGCTACHWGGTDYGTYGGGWCTTVRLLAAPYSGRPGFDAAWKLPDE